MMDYINTALIRNIITVYVVRRKGFWRDQKQSTKTELHETDEHYRFTDNCLSIGLKPTFGINTSKHGSDNIEGLLKAVGKTLLKEDF